MANQAKQTTQLPVVNSVAQSDRLIVVYNANSSSNTAQTATITVQNYELKTLISDPANSTAYGVVAQGTVLYSQNYIYVADQPNHLKRVLLSSF